MKKRILAFFLVFLLVSTLLPLQAGAEGEAYALQITVNGEQKAVRAYNDSYEGNLYLSLTDLAAAFSATEKCFRFERIVSSADGEYFSVSTGQTPVLGSGAGGATGNAAPVVLSLARNRLIVDGGDRKYYTYNPQNGDLFMSVTDVQLMLDMTFEKSESGWIAKPNQHFIPDVKVLRDEGYFDNISSVFLADADSGEALFLLNGYNELPVASLTKLLSYYILREGIDAGEIKNSDSVRISDHAYSVSRTQDGIVPMEAGAYVPFKELMDAMLVASSNEAVRGADECQSQRAWSLFRHHV